LVHFNMPQINQVFYVSVQHTCLDVTLAFAQIQRT
jgi:hypothetical protein